jgi:serine/threonine-protein kinase HipA
MSNSKCLYCYEELDSGSMDYHAHCSQKFFGIYPPPSLEFSLHELENFGDKIIHSLVTIPGVQQKISLGINKNKELQVSKPTIMGLWGDYI